MLNLERRPSGIGVKQGVHVIVKQKNGRVNVGNQNLLEATQDNTRRRLRNAAPLDVLRLKCDEHLRSWVVD